MSAHHDARLVTGALDAAVATRGCQRLDGTIFHSDREYVGAGAPGLPDPHTDGRARIHGAGMLPSLLTHISD
jgi:hypothetical protein